MDGDTWEFGVVLKLNEFPREQGGHVPPSPISIPLPLSSLSLRGVGRKLVLQDSPFSPTFHAIIEYAAKSGPPPGGKRHVCSPRIVRISLAFDDRARFETLRQPDRRCDRNAARIAEAGYGQSFADGIG
jgi:hypothetical protein